MLGQTTRSGNGLIITGFASSHLRGNVNIKPICFRCECATLRQCSKGPMYLATASHPCFQPPTPQSCVRYQGFVFPTLKSKNNRSLISRKNVALPGTSLSMHVETQIHAGTRIHATRVELFRVASTRARQSVVFFLGFFVTGHWPHGWPTGRP